MPSAKTRDMGDDVKSRGVFAEQAQDYEEARPPYPKQLFDTLIKKADLQPNSRLLEIGPGTGQATLPLARHGYEIVSVELGERLADLARHKLHDYYNVKVITGAFEEIVLPPASFDLIYSATAFHWLEHSARYTKPHKLLKPGGHIAFIQTNHVSDEQGDVFYYATQPIYDKYMPSKGGGSHDLPDTKNLNLDSYEPTKNLDAKLFKPILFKVFPMVIKYDAEEYIKLIGTYSPHLKLSTKTRAAFFGEITELINNKFGGKVTKHYAMSLAIAERI